MFNLYNVYFESITSSNLREAFLEAYTAFYKLHHHPLIVRRLPVNCTTMRAQPIFNAAFWNRNKRHYRIDISNHAQLQQHIPVQELPHEVLVGWFAHELGHIMDYQARGVAGMLRFGLGYVFFPTYRIGAERQADIYAIDHGFGAALLATKKYILEHSSLPDYYKKRIEKFYMSPDEIALLLEHNVSDELKMDKII